MCFCGQPQGCGGRFSKCVQFFLPINLHPPSPSFHSHIQDRLLQLLAGHLLDRADRLDSSTDPSSGAAAAIVAANVEAALERIPALATGVDVNVVFSSPRAFEFTPELALFDLAGVGLVHGWVMGPDDPEASVLSAVGVGGPGASYNALAALAVEAGGGGSGGGGGGGLATTATTPRPARSLLDEDWPVGGDGATAATPPSPPPAAPALAGGCGLESVPSADLADAVEARLSLGGGGGGGRRRCYGPAVPPEVAALVAGAVAKAKQRGGASAPPPATTTQAATAAATPSSTVSRAALASAASSFLARTATQLTHAGLVALHDPAAGGLATGELAALFRGSHFAVAYARPCPPYGGGAAADADADVGGGVFTLVTDVGYRGRGVVWERLDGVSGDTTLVGDDFRPPRPPHPIEGEGQSVAAASTGLAGADGDADLALAMRLQAEEDAVAAAARDRARARREEAERAQQGQQQQTPPPRRTGSGLMGFGSGRRPTTGGGGGERPPAEDKCVVM